MDPEVKINELPDYLHIQYSGEFRLAEAKTSVDAMLEACRQSGSTKVLFDCTAMCGELTVMDRFNVGQYASEKMDPRLKIAMVADKKYILPDNFFEVVARNRGIYMRVFSEKDEAIEWLRS
jgi:hypothetical protein